MKAFLLLSITLILVGSIATSKVVFLDNFNGNPDSFTYPLDNINYVPSIPDEFQRVHEFDKKGSRSTLYTNCTIGNYLPGGLFSNFQIDKFASVAAEEGQFKLFTIKPGEKFRQTTTLKVETWSEYNPLSDFIGDNDYRRGAYVAVVAEPIYGFTFCVIVSGTEIWLLNDSLGPLLGLPYKHYQSVEKIGTKLQDDVVSVTSEYDSYEHKFRWYVDDVLVKEATPGPPAGYPAVRRYPGATQDLPDPIPMLNTFAISQAHIATLDFADEGNGKAPVRLGPQSDYVFPTEPDFDVINYPCFDETTGVPITQFDVPGFCPVLSGYNIRTTLYKLKVEVTN